MISSWNPEVSYFVMEFHLHFSSSSAPLLHHSLYYMYVQYLVTDLDVFQTVFVFTVQVHYQQPYMYSNKLIIWPLIIINGCLSDL